MPNLVLRHLGSTPGLRIPPTPTRPLATSRAPSTLQSKLVGATNPPGQVTGFIYVYRVGVDTMSDIIGTNASRLSNGKAPYRVLVDDAAQAAELRQGAVRFKADNAALLSSADVGPLRGARAKRFEAGMTDMVKALRLAIDRFDDLLIDHQSTGMIERLDPASTKLYVACHGVRGRVGIFTRTADGLVQTSPDSLAEHLRTTVRLDLAYRDLRLLACHGASPPENADGISTLDSITRAMAAAGFGEMTVSAYPGKGLKFPKVFDGRLHNAVLPDGKSRPVRRSSVRESLTTAESAR